MYGESTGATETLMFETPSPDGFQVYGGQATNVVEVKAGNTYQFGCFLDVSAGYVGSAVNCMSSYICN